MSKQQPTYDDLYLLARFLARYTLIPNEQRKQHYEKLRFRIGNEYFYFLLPDVLPDDFSLQDETLAPGIPALDLPLARSLLASRNLFTPVE